MLSGYKTYIVAALMLLHAVSAYLLGYEQALDIRQILEALGIAALRAGVAKR
jgi:hypothetical protein